MSFQRIGFKLILAFLLTLFVCGTLEAATYYVPDDYPSIQGAIVAVSASDEIIVRDGTYQENLDFLGKEITLRSENGPETTIIDGSSLSEVTVTFANGEGEAAVLEGFTITHRNTASGGGILCSNSSPTITGNIITGNTSSIGGGGIHCYYASPNITNNIIKENGNRVGCHGGGIYCYSSSPTVSDNTIVSNSAGRWGNGDGIYCENYSWPHITNNIISNNSSVDGNGRGIYCYNHVSPTISGNIITNNEGGICCTECSGVDIIDNIIMDNTRSWGGGILCLRCPARITIKGNIISGNRADSGGGIDCYDDTEATIADNTITSNYAGRGGAIYCHEQASVIVSNNTIRNNEADYGAGINGGGCSYLTITGNTISSNKGAAICSGTGGATFFSITNNIIRNTIQYGRCYASIDIWERNTATIVGNLISKNYTAGIDCASYSTVIDNVIQSNNNTGVSCRGEFVTISGNIIRDNVSVMAGGIWTSPEATSVICNNLICSNQAVASKYPWEGGGGIYCENGWYSSGLVTGNIIRHNYTNYNGGGIWIGNWNFGINSVTVSGNIISDNHADGVGGGIYGFRDNCGSKGVTLSNNIIVSNSAVGGGGGVYLMEAASTLINNTIVDNYDVGIHIHSSSKPVIRNCILWNNEDDLAGGDASMVSYCDIGDGDYEGLNGNISCRPQFLPGSDYLLSMASCCIDVGSADGAPTEDLDGDPRPCGLGYDIGADELTTGVVINMLWSSDYQGKPKQEFAAGEEIRFNTLFTVIGEAAKTYPIIARGMSRIKLSSLPLEMPLEKQQSKLAPGTYHWYWNKVLPTTIAPGSYGKVVVKVKLKGLGRDKAKTVFSIVE